MNNRIQILCHLINNFMLAQIHISNINGIDTNETGARFLHTVEFLPNDDQRKFMRNRII